VRDGARLLGPVGILPAAAPVLLTFLAYSHDHPRHRLDVEARLLAR
jgi:hypothetical protein